MEHILRDSNGRPVGKIKNGDSGRLEGRDVNGRLKGTYDPRSDETRDSNGRVVGKGNLLAVLITSSLYV